MLGMTVVAAIANLLHLKASIQHRTNINLCTVQ